MFDFYMESIEALKHSELREKEFKGFPTELWDITDIASRDTDEWLSMSKEHFQTKTPDEQVSIVNNDVDSFLDKYFDGKDNTDEIQTLLRQNRSKFVQIICNRIGGKGLYTAGATDLANLISATFDKHKAIDIFLNFCYNDKNVINEWAEQYNISIGDGRWDKLDIKDKIEFIRTTLLPLDESALISRLTELQDTGYDVTSWFKKWGNL